MDLNFLREPAMMIFALAMSIELLITIKVYLSDDVIPMHPALNWATLFLLVSLSGWNANAAVEVYYNTDLGQALITKLGYCVLGVGLTICHVLSRKPYKAMK